MFYFLNENGTLHFTTLESYYQLTVGISRLPIWNKKKYNDNSIRMNIYNNIFKNTQLCLTCFCWLVFQYTQCVCLYISSYSIVPVIDPCLGSSSNISVVMFSTMWSLYTFSEDVIHRLFWVSTRALTAQYNFPLMQGAGCCSHLQPLLC